ncbi:MAG: response regulator [Calditrichia bacterium]
MPDSKIMVVDDDYSSRLFLKKVLEKENYPTTACSDGIEALDVLSKQSFDLIITDLKMESIGGIELLEKIKNADAQIAVIILTGHASIQTAIEALRLGASDYLIKPINIEELRIRVKKALERRDLEKRLTEAERRITYNATITTANHEINQPLTVILSGVDMIRMELEKHGDVDAKINNYLQLIQKSGHRISNILRRFREISSPVIQKIPHGMQMIELNMDHREKTDKDHYILIIEDEENLREVIKDVLENKNYKVITASTAKEGIELYKTNQHLIGLVLLDFFLPDGSGAEVFRLFKQFNPNVQVVLMSGFELDEAMQGILDAGAIGFLAKPFTQKQIISFVQKVFNGNTQS